MAITSPSSPLDEILERQHARVIPLDKKFRIPDRIYVLMEVASQEKHGGEGLTIDEMSEIIMSEFSIDDLEPIYHSRGGDLTAVARTKAALLIQTIISLSPVTYEDAEVWRRYWYGPGGPGNLSPLDTLEVYEA